MACASVIDMCDTREDLLLEYLAKSRAVYIMGGDTYILTAMFRRNLRFAESLKKQLLCDDVCLITASAGTVALSGNVSCSWDSSIH